jgi:hypothetical protein
MIEQRSTGGNMSNNKPVHTINCGTVCVSICCNPAPFGEVYSVAASRCYRNGEKWARSTSFSEFDLPILSKLLLDAHSYILTRKISQHDVITLPPPMAAEHTDTADKPSTDAPELPITAE